MRSLALALKLGAPVFILVGIIHLLLGLQVDVLFGAKIPPEALLDPAVNSQNRFLGVCFSLYGVLLYLCATDLRKYATVFQCVIWVFFAGGLARVLSIVTHGMPPPAILGLMVTELALPPVMALWFARATRG